ncbi:hypothetical protein BJY59DRAFT_139106 [Rhodotorula toruloides]
MSSRKSRPSQRLRTTPLLRLAVFSRLASSRARRCSLVAALDCGYDRAQLSHEVGTARRNLAYWAGIRGLAYPIQLFLESHGIEYKYTAIKYDIRPSLAASPCTADLRNTRSAAPGLSTSARAGST